MAGGINIASLFATIGADTSGLQSGLGKAKTSLESFGGSMLKQIAGVVSLTAAIGAAGKFISSSVTDWADYADSMRLSAQTAGITTEEMSRLAQAADDFRVPIGTLQKSMEMALKNGFLPTIENIALLSDELLAMDDPAQRASVAAKIFGKSYADMMPFLLAGGDAIREGTAAIDDSLVVTSEAAQGAKEYKDQVDNVSDAWTGFKNEFGKAVLPGLTSTLKQMTDSGDISGLRKMAGDNLKELAKLGKITGKEYDAGMKEIYNRNKTTAESMIYLNDVVTTTAGQLYDAKAGYEAYAQAMSGAGSATSGMTQTTAELNAESVITKAKIEAVTKAYEEQRDVLEEGLIDAQMNLSVSISTYREGVAGSLLKGLKDAGLEGEDMIERLKLIDQYAGTNYTVEYKMEMAIPDLLKTLIENPEAFAGSMAAFDNVFLPLQTDVIVAQGQVDALQQQLNDLEKQYNITIDIVTTGSLPNLPTDDWSWSGGGGGLEGRASGGTVKGNYTYLVGERGPELFVPDTNGSIIPNNKLNEMGQGVTNNYYNLTMPTTANAGDIRTAFELMEAWA